MLKASHLDEILVVAIVSTVPAARSVSEKTSRDVDIRA